MFTIYVELFVVPQDEFYSLQNLLSDYGLVSSGNGRTWKGERYAAEDVSRLSSEPFDALSSTDQHVDSFELRVRKL